MALRTCPQVADHLRPEKNDWPAALAFGDGDGHPTGSGDLVYDVVEPSIIQRNGLEEPSRRANLAAAKVESHPRAVEPRRVAALPEHLPVGHQLPACDELVEDGLVYRCEAILLALEKNARVVLRLGADFPGQRGREEMPRVFVHG